MMASTSLSERCSRSKVLDATEPGEQRNWLEVLKLCTAYCKCMIVKFW